MSVHGHRWTALRWAVPPVCALLSASAGAQETVPAPPPALAGVGAYVERVMRDWQVPGLALAVVKNDTVVFVRGYGVREVGKPARVDERTVFGAGSVTKSFTAAVVAALVDEGKLAWDDRLAERLPGFALADPYLTRETTLRDALSHRVGLPRASLGLMNEFPRAELVRRLRHVAPAAPFRTRFTYQNQLYVAAGEAAARAAGASWDALVRERLFIPLGMTASSTSVDSLAGRDNVAQPHARIGGAARRVPFRNLDNTAQAGAVNTTVLDLARWARMHLGRGELDGRRVVSAASVREMHAQQIAIPIGPTSERLFPSTHLAGYGLGWFVRDYRGRKLVEHGGNVDGMTAQVALVPEERLGVVVLSNMDSSPVPMLLMYQVIDAYLGARDGPDLNAEYLALAARGEAQRAAAARAADSARVRGTRPSIPLARYAGAYADSLYGTATVALERGSLVLHLARPYVGALDHWERDTFRVRWGDALVAEALGVSLVTFTTEGGQATALTVPSIQTTYRRAPELDPPRASSGDRSGER